MEAVLVLGLGVALLAFAARYAPAARLRRRLRNAPRVSLADLDDGQLARVVGRAGMLEAHLVGPLTGRPCVYYIATLERENDSDYQLIVREARGVPFVLDDDTGRAIVDPTHAAFALDFDAKSVSGTFNNPTPVEQAFLERHHSAAAAGSSTGSCATAKR